MAPKFSLILRSFVQILQPNYRPKCQVATKRLLHQPRLNLCQKNKDGLAVISLQRWNAFDLGLLKNVDPSRTQLVASGQEALLPGEMAERVAEAWLSKRFLWDTFGQVLWRGACCRGEEGRLLTEIFGLFFYLSTYLCISIDPLFRAANLLYVSYDQMPKSFS